MTSSLTDPVATGLQAVITALSPTVKAYKWPPKELDSMPAAVIELPRIVRAETDEAEDHIGATDWNFEFPVPFYFDLGGLDFSHSQAAEIIEAFIRAVDAAPTLAVATSAIMVQDSKVVAETAEHIEEAPRPTLRWLTNVHVFAFATT